MILSTWQSLRVVITRSLHEEQLISESKMTLTRYPAINANDADFNYLTGINVKFCISMTSDCKIMFKLGASIFSLGASIFSLGA